MFYYQVYFHAYSFLIQNLIFQATSICDIVKRPTQKHVEAMRKLFPSSSSSATTKQENLSDVFDPSSTKKRKRKPVHFKPSKVEVYLMHSTATTVPIRKHRNALRKSNRIAKLEMFCNMTTLQTKNAIIRAFSHLKLGSFKYLSCTGNSLTIGDLQAKDGGMVIDEAKSRKGIIYIKESVEVSHCHTVYVMHKVWILRNPWIVLRKVVIDTLRKNPWIAQ